jgi:hypothetical protein
MLPNWLRRPRPTPAPLAPIRFAELAFSVTCRACSRPYFVVVDSQEHAAGRTAQECERRLCAGCKSKKGSE